MPALEPRSSASISARTASRRCCARSAPGSTAGAARPDATYLIAPETGRDELRRTAPPRAPGHLSRATRGHKPGERVALLMPNGYQTCRLFIGAMYGGYCVTPLNLLAQPSQLAYVLEHSDAEIVFVAPDQVERLQQAMKGWRSRRAWWCAIRRCRGIPVACRAGVEPAAGRPWRGRRALMMYTSGTTGKPKGVVLAQRAVVSGGNSFRRRMNSARGPRDGRAAAVPHQCPGGHRHRAAGPWRQPGAAPSFSASNFWQTVADTRAAPGSTWCRPSSPTC
jgi:long-chain acyl-CoA synthetase